MKKPRRSDPAVTAKRIVSQTIAEHEKPLPPGIEAAWEAWSRGVGKVDERGMALLRAAFEVGVEAAKSAPIKSKRRSSSPNQETVLSEVEKILGRKFRPS